MLGVFIESFMSARTGISESVGFIAGRGYSFRSMFGNPGLYYTLIFALFIA